MLNLYSLKININNMETNTTLNPILELKRIDIARKKMEVLRKRVGTIGVN